jgi:hypothetical protein
MTFKEWIAKRGDRQVGAMLGLSQYAVRSWRLGTRTPRIEEARKMIAIDPKLTLDIIYAPPAPVERSKKAA